MENKIRHLELIQGVVNRLSSNSFMLKGWAVTLVAGIFVLAGKDTEKLYFLVAYVPVIIFGGWMHTICCKVVCIVHYYDKVRQTS